MPTRIYCGKYDLPPDYDKMGTRLICLQKGIGVGMSLEKKANKKGHSLFKKRSKEEKRKKKSKKIYCGYKDELPRKYAKMGTRYRCFKKGIGVGIMLKHKKSTKKERKKERKKEKEEGKRISSSKKPKRPVRKVKSGSKKRSIKKRSSKRSERKRRSTKRRSSKKKPMRIRKRSSKRRSSKRR